MKQYGTAPGQNNYTPDFLQHFDQKDGGKINMLKNFLFFHFFYYFPGRAASQAGEGSPPQSASVQQQQLQQQQQPQVR